MVLPKDTLLARYAFSQALARSSALSVLESKLDEFLHSVSALPVTLSKTGKVGLSRREVIMKLGELMIFRQGINLNHENFLDIPDFYWAEPQLEGKLQFHRGSKALLNKYFVQFTSNQSRMPWIFPRVLDP